MCLSVCTSEISETERRITRLLSPAWRDPPGELHKLLFEPTRCVVREEKPLKLFGRLRVGVHARTLHFPVTCILGRMNLAHRLNVVGTFSKVTCTIVDIVKGYALKDTGALGLVTEEGFEGYALKDTPVNVLHRKDTPVNGLQRKVDLSSGEISRTEHRIAVLLLSA